MKTGKRITILTAVVLLLSLIAALGAPAAIAQTPAPGGGSPSPAGPIGSVEVLGVWGGSELESFQAMVAPWEQETGGQMEFTGTRDLIAVLTTRIQANNPPDIAILPNPGQMREMANEGRLLPLDGILDMTSITQEYSPAWVELGTVNDSLYAIFMKATNKGIIWYDPKVFEENNWQIPESWDDLIQLSDTIASGSQTLQYPWSVGVEAGQASGFAGTDWIAQIFLGEYGGDVYDQWVNHEIPWTDPRVKSAWEKFGQIVHTEGYIPGGATTALSTNFQDASFLPFQDPPQAAMYYEGDFVQGFLAAQFPDQVAGQDYAFFAFPPVSPAGAAPSASPGAPGASPPAAPTMPAPGASPQTGPAMGAPGASPTAAPAPGASPTAAPLPQVPVTGGADLVVAFNDTPAVRSFVEYLSTAEAQEIWVERGGFTSVNSQVSLDAYPNELARQSAEMLINAPVFRYGAGDVMPSAVQTAWWQGVLQYLQNEDQLDSVLEGIESQAATAYQQQ